jgi:putative FmdB family regulatory protein
MPTYQYRCDKCDKVFDIFHAMSEKVECCQVCESPVSKVLSGGFSIKINPNLKKSKPGSLVKEYIKDAKEDLKAERERLSSQEYEKS